MTSIVTCIISRLPLKYNNIEKSYLEERSQDENSNIDRNDSEEYFIKFFLDKLSYNNDRQDEFIRIIKSFQVKIKETIQSLKLHRLFDWNFYRDLQDENIDLSNPAELGIDNNNKFITPLQKKYESNIADVNFLIRKYYADRLVDNDQLFFNELWLLNNHIRTDYSPMKLNQFTKLNGMVTVFKKLNFENTGFTTSSEDSGQTNTIVNNNPQFKKTNYANQDKSPLVYNNNIQDYNEFTPITRTVQMSKWIQNYTSKANYNWLKAKFTNEVIYKLQGDISSYVDIIFEFLSLKQIRIITTKNEIELLIFTMIEKLIKKDLNNFPIYLLSTLFQNCNFLKGSVISCFEIVLFIEHIDDIQFYLLLEAIQLDIYDYLQILNLVQNFDLLSVNYSLNLDT